MPSLAFVIKTFERPGCLARLMNSINRLHPGNRVYIADDSKIPYASKYISSHTAVLDLPFNTGLSYGRNRLFETATQDYLFLCDDDFVMTRHTKPFQLAKVAAANDLDVLAITVRRSPHSRRIANQESFPTRCFREPEPGKFTLTKTNNEQVAPFVMRAEFVANCGVFRRQSVLDMGGWHEPMKVGEHWEFFYRARQTGLRVAEYSKATIDHRPSNPKGYRKYRHSRKKLNEYKRAGEDRHGITFRYKW